MSPNALRSVLFVPGDRPRMLEKAKSVRADAIVLDLEDAVALDRKSEARAMVSDALRTGGYEPYVAVRVNGFSTGLTEQDLEAVIGPDVRAICLAKAETPGEVGRLSKLVEALERRHGLLVGSVSFLLLVETALGILNAHGLAGTSGRTCALCLGGEDLCWGLGAVRTKQGFELEYARAHLVLAARAAGVQAIDTVWTDLQDQEGLSEEARRARQMGFSGKLLIHPSQIEVVHRAFTPSQEAIDYARRVLDAFETATAQGQGVITLDGKMIDAPIVARAREILACAEGGQNSR